MVIIPIIFYVNLSVAANPHKISLSENCSIPGTSMVATIITGNVQDSSGSAMGGVSIVIKGGKEGTQTDSDGNFSIASSTSSGILIFSYVGYTPQEVKFSGSMNLEITLVPDEGKINDVIVVAYGTQRRKSITGAVSTISGKDIQDLPVNALSNTLAGRLPGVIAVNGNGAPGSGSSFKIRGLASPNDAGTLVVVDGVVRPDGLDRINPEDVASVTALKDASAAAQYGARAANGVIVITTKKGNRGKPQITYTGNYAFQNTIGYPEFANGSQYPMQLNQALENSGKPAMYSQDQINAYKNGVDVANWADLVFKKNYPQTQHSLSLSGGSDAVTYYLSVGYQWQGGLFNNINYNQVTFRSNVTAKINKNLSATLNIDGRTEKYTEPGVGRDAIFQNVIYMPPVWTPYVPDGSKRLLGWGQGQQPLGAVNHSGYNNKMPNTFNGVIQLKQDLPFITPGLSIKALAGANIIDTTNKYFHTPYVLWNPIGNSDQYSSTTVFTPISLDQYQSRTNTYTIDLSVNYDHKFGIKHQVSAMLLGEQYQSKISWFNALKQNFTTTDIAEFSASGPELQDISGNSYILDLRRSLVGHANYVYDDKYIIDASFRYDGSFNFPPTKQWGLFPAISAGWVMSDENFFKSSNALSFINYLKMRASAGLVGNSNIDPFQFQSAYSINGGDGSAVFDGASASTASYGVYPNTNVTWEKQKNYNVGLDAYALQSKLNITFDYFFRNTYDILKARELSIPATFGRDLPVENYAQVNSWGYELSAGYKDKINDQLNYYITGNISYSNNKYIKIDDPENAVDYKKQINRPADGKLNGVDIPGFIYGFQNVGYFISQEDIDNWYGGKQFGAKPHIGDIKYADLDGDGEITTTGDQKVLSYNNRIPKIIYGFSGGVKWKSISFDFLFQGAAKMVQQLTGNAQYWDQNRNVPTYLFDAWSPSNTNAPFPAIWYGKNSNNTVVSNIWIKNADYLRLKSATLSYTFGKESIKKLGFGYIQIFATGTNLLTFTGFKYFDPEAESNGLYYYPQQRTIALGLKVNL